MYENGSYRHHVPPCCVEDHGTPSREPTWQNIRKNRERQRNYYEIFKCSSLLIPDGLDVDRNRDDDYTKDPLEPTETIDVRVAISGCITKLAVEN